LPLPEAVRVLHRFETGPETCPYLPSRTAVLAYSVVERLTAAEYEALMNSGHRKFGPFVFSPRCPACTACRPIRIPLAEFRASRSQRRAARRNAELEVRVAPPTLDEPRLRLYERYHAAQAERRGWAPKSGDPDEYAHFLHNPVPAMEITLWDGDRLLAVVLTDVTPNVISGVYHYHDPDLAERSLGTACMLATLDLGRRLGKRWAYFGYFVAGCGSLEYKARFRPCELLGEDGVWRPFPAAATPEEP
jgi:arginyl-tRNA--protein-N-Asp/Glu arginylyltransferase